MKNAAINKWSVFVIINPIQSTMLLSMQLKHKQLKPSFFFTLFLFQYRINQRVKPDRKRQNTVIKGIRFSPYMPDILLDQKSPDTLRAVLSAAVTITVFLGLSIRVFDRKDVK